MYCSGIGQFKCEYGATPHRRASFEINCFLSKGITLVFRFGDGELYYWPDSRNLFVDNGYANQITARAPIRKGEDIKGDRASGLNEGRRSQMISNSR
ncbi:hypothetical protein CDAR_109091 [Caerostris darwini]|uniref:Uncharacterized protein n=1 Tax=Caerostris darwini TaxID=1538125 RepID=A0AAV4VE02_9ARAC|nr:hypothetical protein CDAR_109091 [Caerostris darwini]